MNKFLFKTSKKITDKEAKNLIGKHIHFTWYNKEDDVIETLPGMVLDYNEKILKIYTMDILFDNKDIDDSNRFVKNIRFDEISNIFIFDKYTKDFWKLLDNLDDKNILNKDFKITNVFDQSINTKIINYNIPLSLTILVDNKEIDYPLYFVKSINKK